MNHAQTEALAHFERFYPAFAEALDDEDAERVNALVTERGAALECLLEVFAGEHLPEHVRAHIEGSEALMRTRLVAFYDRLLVRLTEQQQRSYAVERYQAGLR